MFNYKMSHKFFRPLYVLILAAVQMLAGITPALAAPPVNDNFADAVSIDILPFSHWVDITDTTFEDPFEPFPCGGPSKSVWYKFTTAITGELRADMAGTTFPDTILNVYQDTGSGLGGLVWFQCTTDFGDTGYAPISVEAGQTYYFQAGSYNGGTGELHFNLQSFPPPANDNFTNATAISPPIPVDAFGTTFAASSQDGEHRPSCSYIDPGPNKTVWYSFTPSTGGSISAGLPTSDFLPVIAVYTGNALEDLTEIGCQTFSNLLTFVVEAGVTYYVQIGNLIPSERGGTFQLSIGATPLPFTNFYVNPSDPSRYDIINFQTGSSDPANIGIETYEWDFGDGNTGDGYFAPHQYAKDGDYLVTHSVTTFDGRTASTTQNVQIRTHDVAITRITAPISSNSGQTKTVAVALRNTNYPEQVQIDLYKSTSTGFVYISSLTKFVPALSGNRTTNVNFSYTFTRDDAMIGKVTFKVIATVLGFRDALLTDNELVSSPPTKVAR